MYIGLISDTHGVFDAPFRDFLAPVDEIWHAGDFGGGMELAEQIAAYKPLVGVAPPEGGFSICKITQRYCVYPLMGNRTLSEAYSLNCFS